MAAVFRASRQLFMAASKSSAAAKKNPPKIPKSKPKPKPEADIKPKRAATGIQLVKPVSSQLEKFCGAPEISRSSAVKKIWEHIKENNLQNPSNKREIICDDKLKTIFSGRDTVGFLEIGKLLTVHFVKNK